MRILVTGGAGFIGSHLCESLLALGHHVTCLDDLSLGRRENISHLTGRRDFIFHRMSLLDQPSCEPVFESSAFECVFHMAANSDIQQGAACMDVDLQKTFLTTFHTLSYMKRFKVKGLVFASSSAVYGNLHARLHEDTGPLFPISFYGAAKLASEAYISAAVENHGVQAWIFRFPNVVGERATHGAMYDFIRKLRQNPRELEILGDGTQEKPYLYVKDLVEGILFGWQNAREKLNCFHLGVDSRTTVTTIGELVVEEMGLSGVAFRYTGGNRGWVGDVPRFDYSMDRINALGWRAARSSDEAVRLAIRAELEYQERKA